ncbi:MAG: prohibitin family protein [Bacteroidetes bacterium]|nr:prohibitin family protein [Bacteroidota bacterium]
MENKKILPLAIVVGMIALSISFLPTMFITIKSGCAGVLYQKFKGGTLTKRQFEEGFHIIAPWNKMYIYDVRTREGSKTMDVLSNSGLSIKLNISFRYAPKKDELGILHKKLGKNYVEKIVVPEISSSARKVIGKYTPEQLYSSKRDLIQEEIFSEAKNNILKNHINLDTVLIRSITLPETIKIAIEKKLKQEQESKEYEFKLIKESKEAERKRIEAKGIKDFQDIVSKGISDKLLKWKGIEATLELAQSNNTKVVIVGQGKEGLPIILGNN